MRSSMLRACELFCHALHIPRIVVASSEMLDIIRDHLVDLNHRIDRSVWRARRREVLQVFPPRRCDPLPEDWASDLHIYPVEGAHAGLDPVLIDLGEEVLDSLLGLRGCWVGRDAGAGPRRSR